MCTITGGNPNTNSQYKNNLFQLFYTTFSYKTQTQKVLRFQIYLKCWFKLCLIIRINKGETKQNKNKTRLNYG